MPNSELHEKIARVAREILRERFVSIDEQADALAAAVIESLADDEPPS